MDTKIMDDYQQSVIDDRNEFEQKIDKLKSWMGSKHFNDNLNSSQVRRLFRQKAIMELYVIVLTEHIEEFV